MSYQRSEIAVGGFLLVGVAITLFGIFKMGGFDGWFGEQQNFHSFYENVNTIEEGSVVKFAGMKVGRVNAVRLDPEQPNRIRVEYTITLDQQVHITDRMEAKITKADLLGDEYIDIRVRGALQGSTDALAAAGGELGPGSEIPAGEPFDLQRVLEDLGFLVGRLDGMLAGVEGQLEDAMDQVTGLLEDAGGLLSDDNVANISAAIADVRGTTTELKSLVGENRERVDSIFTKVDSATGGLDATVGDVRDTVAELRPNIDEVASKLQDAVQRLDSLLGEATVKLDTFDVEQVNEVMENLDVSSRNLAEFTHEIKQRPYRLIRKEKQPPKEFK